MGLVSVFRKSLLNNVLLSTPQDNISGDTHFVKPAIVYAETFYVLITQCLNSALRETFL
jgi:hypothetical protein